MFLSLIPSIYTFQTHLKKKKNSSLTLSTWECIPIEIYIWIVPFRSLNSFTFICLVFIFLHFQILKFLHISFHFCPRSFLLSQPSIFHYFYKFIFIYFIIFLLLFITFIPILLTTWFFFRISSFSVLFLFQPYFQSYILFFLFIAVSLPFLFDFQYQHYVFSF